MRRLFIFTLTAACTGAATEDTADTELSALCAAEAGLRAEQESLGLTAVAVCADLTDLGDTTLAAAGVLPEGADFGAILAPDALVHRAEFEGTRRLYGFMGVTISVPSASDSDTELALLTAQAWKRWSETPSFAVVAEMGAYPTADTLDCCAWRNRFDHVVLSLDPTPLDIGASVSVVASPSSEGDEQRYANTALMSLDRETVLGTNANQGSKAIYGAADPRENLLRYFADGAVFTLAHESTHLYIDQRNSVSAAANRIYDGRTYVNSAYVSAEEVVANYTACEALQGSLTAEMIGFNAEVVGILRGYEGVNERLEDLRTYSVTGAERLKLTASAACGG